MIFVQAAFVLILVAAAISDVMTYRIPNVLVLALGALFIIAGSLHFAQTAWLSHFGAALLCLAGGLVFYQFGQMGAGDVKLLTALALWAGMGGLIALLLYVSLSGLVALPLILLARSLVVWAQATKRWREGWAVPRVLTKKQGVPYGVAIAFGGILMVALTPTVLH
jgi:prepilin peptidase CpaA